MQDTDKYDCTGSHEVNAQVQEMVVALKTIVILAVMGLEYHFLPNAECQYVIGHNAHKPMVVCEQLNNILEQCINFA